MRVVHVSSEESKSGASRAANRLHQGLKALGCSSLMFVWEKQSQDPSVAEYPLDEGVMEKIHWRLRRERLRLSFLPYKLVRSDAHGPFHDDRTPNAGRVSEQCPPADIINLHSVSGFVDISAFLRRTEEPIVWTLHDMTAFTGGCQYNRGCRRYITKCGACPQLHSKREKDFSRSVWKRKKGAYQKVIRDERLHIVTPSKWLAEEARKSSLLNGAPVSVIPYGIDTEKFKLKCDTDLRSKLGITPQKRVLLFVAQYTTHRKGFDLLRDALSCTSDDDVVLVSIGGDDSLSLDSPLDHMHLGRVEDDEMLIALYNLADVFVIPSRQDNLPNVVLESMACGTPVVGFEVGGIPDMVRPGETGWLAEPGNARSLRKNIEDALEDDKTRNKMGENSRKKVENKFSSERQAKSYLKIYKYLQNA